MSKNLEALLRAQERLQRRIERLASLPSEPTTDDPDGALVVWFQGRFVDGGQLYTYAAVKAGRSWFLTGGKHLGVTYSWETLMDVLHDSNFQLSGPVWKAETWVEVL